MLPVVAPPIRVTRNIVIYAVAMVVFSLILIPVAPMGWLYAIAAVLLGAWFTGSAMKLWLLVRRGTDDYVDLEKPAMRVFHGSITYLALLFLFIGLSPFIG